MDPDPGWTPDPGLRARTDVTIVYDEFRAWSKHAYVQAARRQDAEATAVLDTMHDDLVSRLRAAIDTMRELDRRGLPDLSELPTIEPWPGLGTPDSLPSTGAIARTLGRPPAGRYFPDS
jgi:hypothetical protein